MVTYVNMEGDCRMTPHLAFGTEIQKLLDLKAIEKDFFTPEELAAGRRFATLSELKKILKKRFPEHKKLIGALIAEETKRR